MQNVAIVSFLTISVFSLAISCHGAAEPSHQRCYELLGLEHAISARSLKDPELLRTLTNLQSELANETTSSQNKISILKVVMKATCRALAIHDATKGLIRKKILEIANEHVCHSNDFVRAQALGIYHAFVAQGCKDVHDMARHAARTQQEQYPSSYFAAHEVLELLEDMGYKDDYPGSDEAPNPFDG